MDDTNAVAQAFAAWTFAAELFLAASTDPEALAGNLASLQRGLDAAVERSAHYTPAERIELVLGFAGGKVGDRIFRPEFTAESTAVLRGEFARIAVEPKARKLRANPNRRR